MNRFGHRENLEPRQFGNMNAVTHGAFSRRAMEPRAREVADALLKATYGLPIDRIGAEEIAQLIVTIETIDEHLHEHGMVDRRGKVHSLVDYRIQLSRRLERWLREYLATPSARAQLAERIGRPETLADIVRHELAEGSRLLSQRTSVAISIRPNPESRLHDQVPGRASPRQLPRSRQRHALGRSRAALAMARRGRDPRRSRRPVPPADPSPRSIENDGSRRDLDRRDARTGRDGARLYTLAADRDQGLILSAMRGFVVRTPILEGALVFSGHRVSVPGRDIVLEVLAADAASSWGLIPDFTTRLFRPALTVLRAPCRGQGGGGQGGGGQGESPGDSQGGAR